MFAKPNLAHAAGTPCSITPVLTEANLDTCIAEAPTDNSEFDITIGTSFSLTAVKNIPAGTNITIGSNIAGGTTLSLQTGNTARHFAVNGTLTLASGVTLQGYGDGATNGGGVSVAAGGTFNMTGGLITGARSSNGAIHIVSGTFNMSGGTISGNTSSNHGGGVTVYSNATFNMSGGQINGNVATYYSGGVHVHNSIFNMSGGEINNNSSASLGGGVRIETGSFSMTGGQISGNSSSLGSGIYITDGTFVMSGNSVISGNTGVTLANGGGVLISTGGIFTMNGGEISGNNARNGAGIFLSGTDAQFTMNNNSKIINNTSSNNGGAISSSYGTIIINGGTISGNTATNGGAIYRDDAVITVITGGQITNNTASTDGGAIWISHDGLANLTVSSGAIFSGNSAATATRMRPADQALYDAQIAATSFSLPLPFNGYNNYDISYASDLPTNICRSDSSLWADDTKCVSAPGTGLFGGQISGAVASVLSITLGSTAIIAIYAGQKLLAKRR